MKLASPVAAACAALLLLAAEAARAEADERASGLILFSRRPLPAAVLEPASLEALATRPPPGVVKTCGPSEDLFLDVMAAGKRPFAGTLGLRDGKLAIRARTSLVGGGEVIDESRLEVELDPQAWRFRVRLTDVLRSGRSSDPWLRATDRRCEIVLAVADANPPVEIARGRIDFDARQELAEWPTSRTPIAGTWLRDDGVRYRLTREEDEGAGSRRVIGYRLEDDGAYGCRIELHCDHAGLYGQATFSRRADEGGFFASALLLDLQPDGSFRGTIEARDLDDAGNPAGKVLESHAFRRTDGLASDAERDALRKAARAHLAADEALAHGDVLGASATLAARSFGVPEGPERGRLQARIAALEPARKAAEAAQRDVLANEEAALAAMDALDFATAKARWADVRRGRPGHRTALPAIEICEIALRAGAIAARKDLAGLDAPFAEARRIGSAWSFLVVAHIAGLRAALDPADTGHGFDRAVALFRADRPEDARKALEAILAKDAGATSRAGVSAARMAKAIERVEALRPRLEDLEDLRDRRAQEFGDADERVKDVDQACQATRREMDEARALFELDLAR